MERNEILEQMQPIFRDVLDNEEIKLEYETTAGDIEEWDSLSQIQLVLALQNHFGIKMTAKEIMQCDNIGDMVDYIRRKLND